MSQQTLEAVIGRAILAEEFRLALLADPETALSEYELTKKELAALKSVDAESLDTCAILLGTRMRPHPAKTGVSWRTHDPTRGRLAKKGGSL